MAKKYNNGISTATGLNISAPTPADDRFVVTLFADLASMVNKYDGLITKVVEDGKTYTYDQPTNTWTELGASLEGFVPYTGATQDVNINQKSFFAGQIYIANDTLPATSAETVNIFGVYGASTAFTTDNRSLYVVKGADGKMSVSNRGNGGILSNTAFGVNSLLNNTSGSMNASFGYQTLKFNTTGQGNVAMGYQTLRENTTGNNNIALGLNALLVNDIGDRNIGIGRATLQANKTGSHNTSIGYQTTAILTDGSYNTVYGARIMQNAIGGSGNTWIGFTTNDNTGLGGVNRSEGSYNTILGGDIRLNSSELLASNMVIIADGQGNRLLRKTSDGKINLIGTELTFNGQAINAGATAATPSLQQVLDFSNVANQSIELNNDNEATIMNSGVIDIYGQDGSITITSNRISANDMFTNGDPEDFVQRHNLYEYVPRIGTGLFDPISGPLTLDVDNGSRIDFSDGNEYMSSLVGGPNNLLFGDINGRSASFDISELNESQIYTLPNKSGTVALLSDLTGTTSSSENIPLSGTSEDTPIYGSLEFGEGGGYLFNKQNGGSRNINLSQYYLQIENTLGNYGSKIFMSPYISKYFFEGSNGQTQLQIGDGIVEVNVTAPGTSGLIANRDYSPIARNNPNAFAQYGAVRDLISASTATQTLQSVTNNNATTSNSIFVNQNDGKLRLSGNEIEIAVSEQGSLLLNHNSITIRKSGTTASLKLGASGVTSNVVLQAPNASGTIPVKFKLNSVDYTADANGFLDFGTISGDGSGGTQQNLQQVLDVGNTSTKPISFAPATPVLFNTVGGSTAGVIAAGNNLQLFNNQQGGNISLSTSIVAIQGSLSVFGDATGNTPQSGDSSNKFATTAYVQNQNKIGSGFDSNQVIKNISTVTTLPTSAQTGTIYLTPETPEVKGSATVVATGTITINIPHTLGVIPSYVNVQARNAAAANISYVTATATNLVVNYAVAPANATSLQYWVNYSA